jgi:hypothetical protein
MERNIKMKNDLIKIVTRSSIRVKEKVKTVYQKAADFKTIHQKVDYYLSNLILLDGHNWILKEMVIKSGKKLIKTKAFILFSPNCFEFSGWQLEGPFPGRGWHLRVEAISNQKSKIISSHHIELPLSELKRKWHSVPALKKRLKVIEKKYLLSLNKNIRGDLL